jgi:hypothetical protein
MRALKRKGLLVLYGANSGLPEINPMELADNGSLFFTRPRLADYVADADAVKRRAQRIFEGLAITVFGRDRQSLRLRRSNRRTSRARRAPVDR